MTSGVSPRGLSPASAAAISTSEYSPATKRPKVAVLSSRESVRRLRASSTSLARIGGPGHDVSDDAAPFGGQDGFGVKLYSELRGAAMGYGHHHPLGTGDGSQAVGQRGRRERVVASHREGRGNAFKERASFVTHPRGLAVYDFARPPDHA